MNKVFERLLILGVKYVTIGAEECETANMRLYTRLGFVERIKTCDHDPCDVNKDFEACSCAEYVLLRKVLK